MSLSNSTDCPIWPDKPDRCKTVLIVQKIFGSLSLVGCALVIMIIVIAKKYNIFVQKLILTLTISAFFLSLSYVIGEVHTETSHRCRFQAFLMQYFDWATLLWVLVITTNLLLIVKEKKHAEYFRWFQVFVWLMALFWSVIPFFGDNYGPAGIWCWVKRDETTLRFGIWYVPLLLIAICMLVIYAYIIHYVLKATGNRAGGFNEEDERNRKIYREELKPLLAYPFIYLVFSIPVFMYRYDDAAHPDKPPNFALTIISSIFTPSTGFCNALAFAVFNATMREITLAELKRGFINLFSRTPLVIHQRYDVDDTSPTTSFPSNPEPLTSPVSLPPVVEFRNTSYQNE